LTVATLTKGTTVGVLGAGTMGAGIAQVAATAGHPVHLMDASASAIERARTDLRRLLDRQVAKNRLSTTDADAIFGRVSFHAGTDPAPFAPAGIVIEAIIEQLEAKRQAFLRIEQVVSPATLLATNTSSLSVTAVAGALVHPERVVGIHFFNPAPLMPLVEVVPGHRTSPTVTDAAAALVRRWDKTVVIARDTPGFIVNRVARPFYGEALRILEEQIADAATVDWAMREIGGFRMGPFELMDLIGNDVNFSVTRSVFEAFFGDPRYRPSITQQRMVEAGLLGRKSGRGYFSHAADAPPPEPVRDTDLGRRIVDRILAMLINEAADAVRLGIATVEDIETAMTRGVNYPKGLLAWGDEIGWTVILDRLTALQAEYGEDRYRPSPLVRRLAAEGGTLTR
jgi:3-hydroxybutyryl-CoA dehydrogenase